MTVAQYAELDGVTVGSTELSVVSGTTALATDTTAGVFQLFVDPVGAGMVKGDAFIFRMYEKVEATGGTKKAVWSGTLSHAQAEIVAFPPLLLRNGWDMTIQKVAGTDRAWDASIRGAQGTITDAYEFDGVTVGASAVYLSTGTGTPGAVTTYGYYQLFVDCAAMAKGDEFEFGIVEKVEATGGTQRTLWSARVQDVISYNYVTPALPLGGGFDFYVKKISGTDRAWDASVRKVA